MTLLLFIALISQDSKNDRTIVIQESTGRPAPELVVESGTDVVSGSPEENIKAAYRKWEQACRSWKNELRSLNGKNLLHSSCGSPKRSEEVRNSEKIYTYKSDAKFKIRVVGK